MKSMELIFGDLNRFELIISNSDRMQLLSIDLNTMEI